MTDNTVCNLGNIKGEKGDKGEKGEKGEKGDKGADGKDGRGIAKTELVNGELVITYTDGTSDNLGSIGGDVTDYTSMLTFTALDDGTLSVSVKSDYQNRVEKIVIPSTYDGRKVTVIAEKAFYKCKYLKYVTIPNTVTQIGSRAFLGTDLTYLNMGDGVTSIGENAFWGCSSLRTFDLSKSLKSIGNGAFEGCHSIESIVLPDGFESLGRFAFCSCEYIKTINIPKSVKYIGCASNGNYANVGHWEYVYFEDPTGWKINYIGNASFPDSTKGSMNISKDKLSNPKEAANELNYKYSFATWDYVKE